MAKQRSISSTRWDESETGAEHSLCDAKSADSKTVKRNRLVACSFGQRPFENSICLIAIGSDRFEKTIDHEIVFKRHAQLAGDSAFDHCFFYHAQHEHLGNAGAAIFFNYAESEQATFSDAILAKQ